MRSLYWKVSAVLLLLLLLLAVVQRSVWNEASTGFMAETDQKLNHGLAGDRPTRSWPFGGRLRRGSCFRTASQEITDSVS